MKRRKFSLSLATALCGSGCSFDDRASEDLIDLLIKEEYLEVALERVITPKKNITISNKKIIFRNLGGIYIRGIELDLINCQCLIYFEGGDNLSPGYAFRLEEGGINIRGCTFLVKNTPHTVGDKYKDSPSPNLVINGINEEYGYDFRRRLNLSSSKFISEARRYAGCVSIGNHRISLNDSSKNVISIASISDCEFIGFNGAVSVTGSEIVAILNNKFINNSFFNCLVTGRRAIIHRNTFDSPGFGDPGDAINVFGDIDDCRIDLNDLRKGSCYGIAVYSDRIIKLEVNGNFVSSFITHGIILKSINESNYWGSVIMTENILTKNVGGIAISASSCGNVRIERNSFQHCLPGWPSPMLSFNETIGSQAGNLIFDHIGVELTVENFSQLLPLAHPSPPIYVTGIR